jgi:CRP/FNR family transcriptional regulator, cyclic AMP receptor protein
VEEAIKSSYLSAFPPAGLKQLLIESVRLDVPAGSMLYRESEEPKVGLVLTGLFRVYMTSAEGRQVTVRYARRGNVLGTAVVVGGPVEVRVQALVDSAILIFSVQTLQHLGRTDARIAWAIAEEVTHRLYAALGELRATLSALCASGSYATCLT